MNKIYLYVAAIAATILSFFSCGGDYDNFVEPIQYTTAPSAVKNITSEALPGKIVLKWEAPSDSNYYFVKVTYYDHLTKKNKAQIASVYRDTITITNTRAKYGDYEFTFQTFNSKNEGGEISKVKARSGIAPIEETITPTKIKLTAAQLSTNAQEATEGPIANLLDGNSGTFFHTDWHNVVPPPHYMDVHLETPVTNFQIYFQNRNGSQACAKTVNVSISNNGVDWELLTTITAGLPSGSKGEYTSPVFRNEKPFTYLRWLVAETYNNTKYWNMAEFAMYDVKISVFDPESPNVQ